MKTSYPNPYHPEPNTWAECRGEEDLAHLEGHERARYVARMFARISRRYDRLNTVMSAGRHYAWRRKAAKLAAAGATGLALDVATGTGDFAMELARQPGITRVAGLDFAREMLSLAEAKTRRKGLLGRVSYIAGDGHTMPFPDDRFVCATVGFGVRNFVDVPGALREVARVLRPSGRVAVLEIVRGEGNGPVARAFPLYFRYVTPWLGALLAGDRDAYTYLPESVEQFRSATELGDLMEQAGLRVTTVRNVALGTVAIIVGEKRA